MMMVMVMRMIAKAITFSVSAIYNRYFINIISLNPHKNPSKL